MLARMRGARSARGDVLVFLDAHCEPGADWLRPLLQRIRHKRDSVLTPLIDVIDQSTFQLETAQEFQVGGFTFMGHFTWIDIPDREKKRRGSDIAPTWSPTMAGGLFAINREYYWELGAYDEQMAGWGGENLEMSFRIWQCGGTLETIPCSRVGHVFRAFHPYGMPASSDTHGINTARMAEVWMDDYKELFYLHRPDLRNSPKIGDVTHRKILREKLQCKSFEWYLQHVYKEKFVPVRDAFGYGRFRNVASGLCLDNLQREGDAVPLGVYPCHETLQGTQYLSLALDGQLRDEERCVELQYTRSTSGDESGRRLLLTNCIKNKHRQKWRYTGSKQLIHVATSLCVDSGLEGGADVLAKPCRPTSPTQRWEIDYNEHNDFRLEGGEPSEAELTLQRLRGQRNKTSIDNVRISRSLLSYGEDSNNGTVRRHTHKKRKHKKSRKHSKVKRARSKTKNKFILKLVRTLMNNTEDHLEVDIHCKHRQLYPNNTFVRDLVTILNEKNIKVINNGRVFERNRVTELVRDPQSLRQKESKVLEKLEVEQRAPEPQGVPQAPSQQPQPAKEQMQQNIVPTRWQSKKRKMKLMRPQQQSGISNNLGPSGTSGPAAAAPPPPSAQAPPFNAGNNGLEQQVVYNQAQEPIADKKIIIEDFVEVKQATSTAEPKIHQQRAVTRQKKRKHKHRAAAAASGTQYALRSGLGEEETVTAARPEPRKRLHSVSVVPQPEYEEESICLDPVQPPQNSLEEIQVTSAEIAADNMPKHHGESKSVLSTGDGIDAILVESGERETDNTGSEKEMENQEPQGDNKYQESQLQGSTRRRQQQASGARDDLEIVTDFPMPITTVEMMVPQSNQIHTRAHNETRPRAKDSSRAGSPLKVVMKSNLTFNLGEEFFKWRSTDDVADLLGELAIPSNSSRAPPPLHAWILPPAPAMRSHPHHHRATSPPPASDESSSSSESAENER